MLLILLILWLYNYHSWCSYNTYSSFKDLKIFPLLSLSCLTSAPVQKEIPPSKEPQTHGAWPFTQDSVPKPTLRAPMEQSHLFCNEPSQSNTRPRSVPSTSLWDEHGGMYLSIYLGCAGSSLLGGLSLVPVGGGYSLGAVVGLLILGVLLLHSTAPGHTGFQSCDAWA